MVTEVMQPQRYLKFLKITIQNIYGWFFTKDIISLFYGDVIRIVKSWQFQFFFSFEKISRLDFFFKMESGQCYTPKRFSKNNLEYLQKNNQMVLHKKKMDQKKCSSDFNLSVVMLSLFFSLCISVIFYTFIVTLHFI